MTQEEYSKRFEKIYQLLSDVNLNFYTWKGLQKKDFQKIFAENNYFWTATLFALENNWLIGIARAFEDSTYSKDNNGKDPKVISVYALFPHQKDKKRAKIVENILKKNESIIKSVARLRDHQLAHNIASHSLKPKDLLVKFPIQYKKIEKLLLLSNEILSNLNPKKGNAYTYEMLSKDSANDSESIIKKLQYYSLLRRQHFEKLKRGEVKDYRFPPEI